MEEQIERPKPNWNKSTDSQKIDYKNKLKDRLETINVPHSINCADVHCNNLEHDEMIEDYCMKLMETIENVAENTLEISGKLNKEK